MTLRLVRSVMENWADFDGWAASQNLPDVRNMPVGRFCNLAWFWLTRNAEPEDVDKLRTKLWIPPKGEVGQGPWSAEAETAAFAAVKAQMKK